MRHFYFSLAKELGMSVKYLLATTDSRELTEWQAFFKIQNEQMEEARSKKSGKVKPKDPVVLSEALKAQLAPLKSGG